MKQGYIVCIAALNTAHPVFSVENASVPKVLLPVAKDELTPRELTGFFDDKSKGYRAAERESSEPGMAEDGMPVMAPPLASLPEAFKDAFFTTPAQTNWNPHADMDNSGVVNFADLQVYISQFFGPPGPSANGCN